MGESVFWPTEEDVGMRDEPALLWFRLCSSSGSVPVQVASLCQRRGRVLWLCLPCFKSCACFASLPYMRAKSGGLCPLQNRKASKAQLSQHITGEAKVSRHSTVSKHVGKGWHTMPAGHSQAAAAHDKLAIKQHMHFNKSGPGKCCGVTGYQQQCMQMLVSPNMLYLLCMLGCRTAFTSNEHVC